MEASFAKKLENEIQLLEQTHQKRLNAIQDEMETKAKEFANKEALMQTNQDKEVQKVRAEMQAIKEAHAEEINSLKNNLLKNSDGLYKKQIDDLTASFNAELERVKAAAVSGGTQLFSLESNPPQNIEDVLNKLQTIYPPDTIKKLRDELRTKNDDLSRLDKDITNNNQQMNALQTKLNASEQSQQTLRRTIESLETWKQKAESDIKVKSAQLQDATSEVSNVLQCVHSILFVCCNHIFANNPILDGKTETRRRDEISVIRYGCHPSKGDENQDERACKSEC